MKKISFLLLTFISLLMFSVSTSALEKNVVTLNFEGGIIHDGYVEYSKVAKLQLFKGDNLVVDITNNMEIDLNEDDYKFVIEEIEDTSVSGPNASVKLNINNWYYPTTKSIIEGSKPEFKLDSSKFKGTLDIKFVRANIAVNTTVENVYEDISSKGVIDLSNGQEYVIDFTKTDELTQGLKSFADLGKTLYYQVLNGGLIVTDNENVAVIKIVGNKSENKAILSAINVGTKKSEVFKGLHTKYTGAALDYDSTNDGIINETRFDYYTRCKYEYTIQYVKEEVSSKEYKFIEGDNQTYTINKDNDMVFKIDADYSLFNHKVYVDDELIDEKNYTSKSGSTIVILNKEYISKLSVGEHTLKVAFTDGEAVTKFVVKNKEINNPETGDNAILFVTTGIISMFLLVLMSSYIKKAKNN
mgnify:CR=1 FL=1